VSLNAYKAVVESRHDPGRFSNAEFRLLIVLADHHNRETGRCNPGYTRLAAETGFSRSYVIKLVQALKDRGELDYDGSSKGGAGNRHNFTLTLGKGHSRVTLWPGEKGHSTTPFGEGSDGV
jgi:hypothetical protein